MLHRRNIFAPRKLFAAFSTQNGLYFRCGLVKYNIVSKARHFERNYGDYFLSMNLKPFFTGIYRDISVQGTVKRRFHLHDQDAVCRLVGGSWRDVHL
jgi:hypothetical protein